MAMICTKDGLGTIDLASGKQSWKRDGNSMTKLSLAAMSEDGHAAILGDTLLVSEVNTRTLQLLDPSRVTARSSVISTTYSDSDRLLPFRGSTLVGDCKDAVSFRIVRVGVLILFCLSKRQPLRQIFPRCTSGCHYLGPGS
jgi:hypothetical protein